MYGDPEDEGQDAITMFGIMQSPAPSVGLGYEIR